MAFRSVTTTVSPLDPLRVKGGVYFIEAAGLVKIGVSANILERFETFQAVSPVPLRLVSYVPGAEQELETWLHNYFVEHRRHGEWFAPCPELVDLIEGRADHLLDGFTTAETALVLGVTSAAVEGMAHLFSRRVNSRRGRRISAHEVRQVAAAMDVDRAAKAAEGALKFILAAPEFKAVLREQIASRLEDA